MRIDLHTHSRVSDGTDSPGELVRAAHEAGVDVVALTDHDSAAGWAEATEVAEALGIGFVPGLEISTEFSHHAVHLLAYLPDPDYPPLVSELQRVLDGRSARVPVMVGKLQALGIEITEDDVHARSKDAAATGRPHVADALVALGVVASRDEAFERYLGWGKPGYAGRYAASLEHMIDLIAEAGGVTVIAHPWGRAGRQWPDEAALAALRQRGLAGIEVDHQDHDPETRSRLRSIAANLGLVATGSSDYHGTGKTGHGLGVNSTDPGEFHRLLTLAELSAAASGRRAPAYLPPAGAR